MTYACEAFELHPKAQLLQNATLASVLQTFRCSKIARTHLVLSLPSLTAYATIQRLGNALKFRISRLPICRELIDQAINLNWPWGKLINGALDKYNLHQEWRDASADLDDSTEDPTRVINRFRTLLRNKVLHAENLRQRAELFENEVIREMVPYWNGIHALCSSFSGALGFLLLRNEFLPPHLLHSAKAPPRSPCPLCSNDVDTPAHLICCPALAVDSRLLGLKLDLIENRWNLRDQELINLALSTLKSRLKIRYAALPDK